MNPASAASCAARPAPKSNSATNSGSFTRDVWAHRIDIAHAIAVEPDHDAVHDGRILADIIAEWAATHGEPFTLVLDGPAGGTFVHGIGGDEVHISVVDFVRTLAERTITSGVLRHTLPL